VEAALVEIWQQVLGVQRVGVHDNFFHLGGDSILSVQIVARANQRGLHLSTRQMFEHQSIAALAPLVTTPQTSLAPQGLVTGPLPLTPIQHWFFDQGLANPNHYNQSLMFESDVPLQGEALKAALAALLHHHDALRLRFAQHNGLWQQVNAGQEAIDLDSVFAELEVQSESELEAQAQRAQESLNVQQGPLLKVLLMQDRQSSKSYLLLVIHHLAVDGVSWRIVLEDLQRAYEQGLRGEAISLPVKSSSYQQWAELLASYAGSEALEQELSYWVEQGRRPTARLPLEKEAGNVREQEGVVEVGLSQEATTRLLREVSRGYDSEVLEVLVLGLVEALAGWSGGREIRLDLEGHGRQELSGEVDVSRTVGWFTSLYPVVVELREGGVAERLSGVKEALRGVPGKGLGYGVWKYMGGGRAVESGVGEEEERSVVSVNYLGQLDGAIVELGGWRPSGRSRGREWSGVGERTHQLEVLCSIVNGELGVSLRYSEGVNEAATMSRLAGAFMDNLLAIIHSLEEGDTSNLNYEQFSDFKWDQEDVDAYTSLLKKLE
jgi:non-ribosomal peptide synthase protein (TIGR01720 family)